MLLSKLKKPFESTFAVGVIRGGFALALVSQQRQCSRRIEDRLGEDGA